MESLDIQIEAYEKIRDVLESEHYGEWVAVHDGKLVGTYESCDEAIAKASRWFCCGPYLIMQVGLSPIIPLIESPYPEYKFMLNRPTDDFPDTLPPRVTIRIK